MLYKEDRIAVYSRKSKFTGRGESIGNQVELSREYIRVHYGEAYAANIAVYEDEGFSGGNLNRPNFKKMMKAAEEHKFRAIVVYRLDRISRNVSDFSGLIEELNRLDIDFISIREQFDTGTPMGRAMMYIASVFSQLERETIAERIRDNMHELAKTGRWLGGTTPTGYASESVKSVSIDGKSKRACKLRLIEKEAVIVRMIYSLYLESDSLTSTESELLTRGIKTKNEKSFTRFSIRGILQNPVYVVADQDAYAFFAKQNADLFSSEDAFDGFHGILAYNRTNQEKGRTTQWRSIPEWIVAVGQHPGIIPGKLWVQVQESLERNKAKAFRKPRSNEALLTGLLYCSCSSRMYPKLSKRRTADGLPVFFYLCKTKERSRSSICCTANANGNLLDLAVTDVLKALKEDSASFAARLKKIRTSCAAGRSDWEDRLNSLRRDKADAEKKLATLVDSLTDTENSSVKTQVEKRIEQLGAQCQSIDARILELEKQPARHSFSAAEPDGLLPAISVFGSCLDKMTVQQKRNAIRAVVQKVIWDGSAAHIFLAGTAAEASFGRSGLLPAL